MPEKIISFDGIYHFLSNFYDCLITYNGLTFNNTEAAFQAAKCLHEEDRLKFVNITAKQSKHLGRKVKLRPDWNDIRISVMKEIIHIKFTTHRYLAERLLATGAADLFEGNYWHDTFWGVEIDTLFGENNLGKILMEERKLLQDK